MKETYRQIIRPTFKNRDKNGQTIIPTMADYITVPRLSTYGTFQVVDLLPFETLAGLSQLRDRLAGVKRRK